MADVTQGERSAPRGLSLLLMMGMAVALLPLFLIGALAPYLVREFDLSAPLLGALVTVGYGGAAVLSLVIGSAASAVGPRYCLVAVFGISIVVLTLFAGAGSYGWLVAAIAVSALGQSLANPATNQLIATWVPLSRRAGATGLKQSGVQLGGVIAGLPLAMIAASSGWRVAVGVGGALAAALAATAVWVVPRDPAVVRAPGRRAVRASRDAVWLAAFSVFVGAGIAAVSTYVALYASTQLALSTTVASSLVAALGAAGVAGRLGWAGVASRRSSPASLLAPLAAVSVLAAGALAASAWWGAAWLWVGVIGVGGCAVAANAVSMITVIARSRPEAVGHDSAVVSAGFFSGYAVGPPAIGALAELAGRYQPGWFVVAGCFACAAVLAFFWQHR